MNKHKSNAIEVRRNKREVKQSGFTLIELLVVLGIVGMLAGLIGPQVMKRFGESKTKAAKLQIEELSSALDIYRLDVGRYPSTEEGLSALIDQPMNSGYWNGPYLRKKKLPMDPWNVPYVYASPGEHGQFDIYSLGADRVAGGKGENQDVNNWE